MMRNPFSLRELPVAAPFCDRRKELQELFSHAKNRVNAVIISSRRFGKTSLVKRIQNRLADSGFITAYVDFFGVDSIEDVAARLAACIYAVSGKNEGLLKKMADFIFSWRPVLRPDREYGMIITAEPAGKKRGIDLLEDTMKGIGRFIKNHEKPLHVVLDEFQEISELRESLQIEGLMRSHIQQHAETSYFFVGSRRRLLSEIFNERKRAFYRSAINYVLKPLPAAEATKFIVERFKAGGKRCPGEIAARVVDLVQGYPFYVQRIPYSIYEVSGKSITDEDYRNGFTVAVEEEKPVFESMLQSLAPQQIRLLAAISLEPSDAPFSSSYMARHNLGSIGGVQGSIKKLIAMDYIEKRDGVFRLVDPVFGIWLRRRNFGS